MSGVDGRLRNTYMCLSLVFDARTLGTEDIGDDRL